MSSARGEGDKGKDNISKSPLPLLVSTVVPSPSPGAVCSERALIQVRKEEPLVLATIVVKNKINKLVNTYDSITSLLPLSSDWQLAQGYIYRPPLINFLSLGV